MYLSITIIVWVIFTTILAATMILRSKWKLNNPYWAEIAADKHIEEKRHKRNRRKILTIDYRPEKRKKSRSKI